MDDIRVASWTELNDKLFEGSWNPSIRRFRSQFVFRGSSGSQYPLLTALSRLGEKFEDLEPHLLRNFRKYAHRDVVAQDSLWHWLSVATHHGLPTRLLDWTYSPYVAMHFATVDTDRFDVDGAIWMVDFVQVHEHLPKQLREVLAEEESNAFTVEMLARSIETLDELDHMSGPEFVIFFEPPSLDQRIINQFALFSVMSSPRAQLDEWFEDHPGLCQKLIIPAELKWEVRDKLDQANITERVLFPGLDGLSSWLKRYYTPRY